MATESIQDALVIRVSINQGDFTGVAQFLSFTTARVLAPYEWTFYSIDGTGAQITNETIRISREPTPDLPGDKIFGQSVTLLPNGLVVRSADRQSDQAGAPPVPPTFFLPAGDRWVIRINGAAPEIVAGELFIYCYAPVASTPTLQPYP